MISHTWKITWLKQKKIGQIYKINGFLPSGKWDWCFCGVALSTRSQKNSWILLWMTCELQLLIERSDIWPKSPRFRSAANISKTTMFTHSRQYSSSSYLFHTSLKSKFANIWATLTWIIFLGSFWLNMWSLQQTPIFISWHFSRFHQTQDTKDAFWIKIQNLKKKNFFSMTLSRYSLTPILPKSKNPPGFLGSNYIQT